MALSRKQLFHARLSAAFEDQIHNNDQSHFLVLNDKYAKVSLQA